MTDQPFLDTIRDSYGRVVYTHKIHEKQREILSRDHEIYKWGRIIVVTLTASGALAVLITDQQGYAIATAVLGFTALLITLYGMGHNFEKSIYGDRRAARELWTVRETYLHLISDLVSERITEDEAAPIRDALTKELNRIYRDAPDTSSRAYNKTRKALKIDEEMTFSDPEIDEFLPDSLKKVSQ